MLNRDVVRVQQAVQAFDFREILKEYGFTVGTKADVDAARKLIAGMVKDADTLMTRLVTDCEELGQNPYKRSVLVNGSSVDFAMEIPLFPAGELTARIKQDFAPAAERNAPAVPNDLVIAAKVREGIAALAREAGYEVCVVELHQDGTPQRIVLRDPAYAAEAAKRKVEDGRPDIADVARLLGEQRVKQLDHTAEAIGITGAASAEQVQSLRAAAKSLVDEAMREITTRLQAFDENEVSPFASSPFRFSGVDINFLDKKLVGWGWGRSIEKPVVIDVFDFYKIRQALNERVPNAHSVVNEHVFGNHVRQALVDRLRAVPNLPLAAIATDPESNSLTKVVLVAPEVWARKRGVALLPSPEKRALPAPAEAIAPVTVPLKL